MTVTIFDGKTYTHWFDVENVRFVETETYILTFTDGNRSTVYGSLICVERR